ncbi:MAG: aldehyde:ferredoxin oxidoreductase [SAR324 cluster bacterium]|nr:aldehyde:ferredoxin oxidoreductase [SAR324 cluster bacterium]
MDSGMYGVHGKILRVNLSTGDSQTAPIPQAIARRYIGGIGLGVWLLLREAPERYEALAPEAPLVFAFAPLAGTSLNTSAKAAVLSKSPLTGRLNDAMISSGFALSGKGAGHDAIALSGACREWSTLFIDPEGVELRETPELAGLSAPETEARIKERWGDDWDVVSIGVAGENQVPFATLTHDGRHAGRAGTGAVMGAKRLKALAVRGREMPPVADPEALKVLRNQLKTASLGPGTEKYRTTGTLGNLLVFNSMGILPTDNFRAGSDGRAEGLSAEGLFEAGRVTRATCADCMIGCEKRFVNSDGSTTRMEYENVFALGSLLNIWDMEIVMAASALCDKFGLDTISTGGTLAFAIECVERGLLEAPGLRSGDGAMLLEAIPKIARREGYGELIALGSRALAERVGQGSMDFAPHVKGLEIPGYHPAALQTLGLGLAVGTRGADHNKSGAYDLDLSGEVDRFQLDETRIAAMVGLEDQAAVIDSLILCKFVRRALGDLYEDGAEMLRALTGIPYSPAELQEAGREIHHLKKWFNQRQGWLETEDTLPARFFAAAGANGGATDEGAGEGAIEGIDPTAFAKARGRYYHLRGWSPEGRFEPGPELAESLVG